MIAAQVAVNYGLFCRKIVFHGLFDNQDKRFFRYAFENTAREIYVNKFLQPNPFIKGAAAELPVVKLKKYCQAELIFKSDAADTHLPWQRWETDSGRIAVLSSGGKDSLLSFGLLDEIGCAVHPVFINESGRHWFTALNAYRYFKENTATSVRVWCNADRVFNRMLHHLPFIRSDYQSIRADIYPVRLWTVAVFLFGALPVMRNRGLSRLVIGDEYDTTERLSYKGITHYGGLYDQSRYFDLFMSRYFLTRGWTIAQFSILRHLSELLIEKILAERYPHLLARQVSCHAVHKEGDRIKPCGKCEKCLRIIGMLSALNFDPALCGYTEDQTESALARLPETHLHQEADAMAHLLYMLNEQQKITLPEKIKKRIVAHPAVAAIRFEKEKAPLNTIPLDLRKKLLKLCLNHADGAFRKVGKHWLEFSPLLSPDINQPAEFDTKMSSTSGTDNPKSGSGSFLLGEMSWPEAQAYLKKIDVALLPVGAIEQHGPHLPLDTDAFDADYLARQVAAACSDPRPVVLPLIPYGISYHHDDFPGTISIHNETLSRMVYEIGVSAARNGIKKLLIINGHGGNTPTLNFAAQMINRDTHIFVSVDSGETSDVDIDELVETPNDVHAGEFETSTALANRRRLVRMDQALPEIPRFSSRYLNFTSKRGISWYAYTNKISDSGIMGDPTRASAEKGRKMWQIMIGHLVTFVEDLKNMSLEEIHQKRY